MQIQRLTKQGWNGLFLDMLSLFWGWLEAPKTFGILNAIGNEVQYRQLLSTLAANIW